MKAEYGLSDFQVEALHLRNKKITAYAIAAARDRLKKKTGYF